MMRFVTEFVGPAIGLTKAPRYQVMYLDTVGKVQLWMQNTDGT